jgi:hypothetical protein
MSGHCCSCDCHTPPTKPPTRPPCLPTRPPCLRGLVRIYSLFVNKITFSSLITSTWHLTITVNDESQTWISKVQAGENYSMGLDFPISFVDQAANLVIHSAGFASGSSLFGGIDFLPPGEKSHDPADNWGMGSTRQLSAINTFFDYTINYAVLCPSKPLVSVISRKEVLRVIRARLDAAGVKIRQSEDELLTVFINKVAARGIRLTQVNPEFLIWEGTTLVQQLMHDIFSERDLEDRRGQESNEEDQDE